MSDKMHKFGIWLRMVFAKLYLVSVCENTALKDCMTRRLLCTSFSVRWITNLYMYFLNHQIRIQIGQYTNIYQSTNIRHQIWQTNIIEKVDYEQLKTYPRYNIPTTKATGYLGLPAILTTMVVVCVNHRFWLCTRGIPIQCFACNVTGHKSIFCTVTVFRGNYYYSK